MFLFELFGDGAETEQYDSGYRDGRETHKFTTSKGQEVVVDFLKDREGYEAIFTIGDRTKATGAGEQFEIFATVIKLIKQFAATHPKSSIMFAADLKEPTRVALYDKLVKRFAPDAEIGEDEYGEASMYIIPARDPA